MRERQPTTSLSAFQGLSSTAAPARRFGADMLATTSLVVGAAVSSAFALIAFGAALVVLESSSIAGIAPTTIARLVAVVAALVSAVGVVAGVMALWRGHVDGAGVAVRATIGLITSSLWPLALVLGFSGTDEAKRDSGVISRPGFLPYADLMPGDCLAEVPPTEYDAAGERVYVVRCELSHRAQVATLLPVDIAAGDAIAAASDAACAAAPVPFELESTDRLVAVHPAVLGQASAARDRIVCVIAHVDDRRFGATEVSTPGGASAPER